MFKLTPRRFRQALGMLGIQSQNIDIPRHSINSEIKPVWDISRYGSLNICIYGEATALDANAGRGTFYGVKQNIVLKDLDLYIYAIDVKTTTFTAAPYWTWAIQIGANSLGISERQVNNSNLQSQGIIIDDVIPQGQDIGILMNNTPGAGDQITLKAVYFTIQPK